MVDSPLKIQLLGTFEVWVNGEPIPRLRTRKGRLLFAHLILKRPSPVQRDWLAAALWPDSLEEKSGHNLRQCLNDLRQALGAEAERIQSPSRRTLLFDDAGADIDVFEFQRLLVPPHPTPADLLRAIS